MGLSTREVLLVLRARDEASRTMSHVSGAMRRLGSDAQRQTSEMVSQQRRVLSQLSTQLGDVNHAYSRTTAQALESHRREMAAIQEQTAALKRQENEIRDVAAQQARESRSMRDSERITAEQYRRASEARKQALNRDTAAIREQQLALANLARQGKRTYNEQIDEARRLHIQQVEDIRQQRIAAQEQLRQHQNSLSQLTEERNAIRARGEQIKSFGYAAIGTGVGMTLMGVAGVRALGSMVKAQLDYQTQARRTLTQVTETGVGLKQIEAIGKSVGKSVPVAFAQIQPALYDIFSSIDVKANDTRALLKQFARDAVGGQSDLETATKANLVIMNAYGISAQHATRVSDFMFRLVQKGVGTYNDFAKSIGLAIPSAVRLGVNLNQLGGTLAFMTRNGLSASRAATSAGRAFDALSNPKTASNLHKMGVEIVNQHHELKSFPTILDLMMAKMKNMTNFQKSSFLKDAFYGSGGTIQALRFFNMVFKNMDQFKKRVGEMTNASGSAKKAFTEMAKGPQAEIQRLQNNWELLRIELGHELLPIALKLVSVGMDIIKAWEGLSPTAKRTIAYIVAIGSAILILGGILTVGIGAIALFVGSAKSLGMTAGEMASKLGRVAGGLTLMVGGMYQAYTATTKTGKAVGIFMSAVGGAAAGSAFGPWGAAIGGVVGALGGLISALHNSKGAVGTAEANYSHLIDTYDQLTGATTQATRAAVLNQLQQSGTLKNLAQFGISARTAVNAILGQASAQKVVSAAVRNNVQDYKALTSQISRLQRVQTVAASQNRDLHTGRVNSTPEMVARGELIRRLQAQADAEKRVIDAVRKGIPDARAAAKVARDRAFATQDLTGKLNALPKEQRTRITVQGVYPTVKGIATVAKQYSLTPRQIKTVISAVGVNTTLGAVKKVEKGLKDVKAVKGDITPYLSTLRAGGHSAAGLSREIGQTALKNLQDGPKKAKANLDEFTATLKAGVTAARGIASSGGHSVGSDLGAGVIAGFRDSGAESQLATEAASAVNRAIAAARVAAEAKSPSRRTIQLGKDLATGLHKGFKDNTKQTHKMIAEEIKHEMAEAKKINLFPRAKELTKELDNARNKLKSIIQAQKSWVQQIKQGITGYASLSSMDNTDVFGNPTSPTRKTITASLRTKLNSIRKFGRLLRRLLKAGYDRSIYRQVAQMDPDSGIQYAQALLDASPKQVRRINRMEGAINRGAAQIAKQSGREMYQAGIKAAQGLVNGLKSKEKALERVAAHIGKAIVKKLKDILGIHSPSREAIKIAFNFGDTFATQLGRHEKDVRKAARKLGQAAMFSMDPNDSRRPPFFPGGGRPPGSGGVTHHHHNKWNITTNGDNPVALGRSLSWEYEKRFKKL